MSRDKLILVLVVLLGAALRFYDLTYQSIWNDEAFSIYAAKGVDVHFMTASLVNATHRKFFNPDRSPHTLLNACINNEGAPPLYYIALAVWIKSFGSSDLTYRSLSLLFGVLSILFFFLLGRQLFRDKATALLATLFIAVSPINIYFSQEVRAYIMANCAAIAASWLFLRALAGRGDWKWWGAYTIAIAVVCYSFYFAALVLLAHLLYALIHERKGVPPLLICFIGAGCLFSPWLIQGFKAQLAVTGGYVTPGPPSVSEFYASYCVMLRYIFNSLVLGPMYSKVVIGDGLRSLIDAGLLALLAAGCFTLIRRGRGRVATFSLLLFFVPFVVIAAYGLHKWTFWYMKPRYHLWESSGIYLLAAASIMAFRSRALRVILATAFCAFSLAAAPYHFYPNVYCSGHAKPDFRKAASIISSNEQRGDIIIVNVAGHMIPLNIYYKGGAQQIGWARCHDDVSAALDRYTARRPRVWLLIADITRGCGDREITDYLNAHYTSRREYLLPGVYLALFSK
jgi:uncharacterized membrane protein